MNYHLNNVQKMNEIIFANRNKSYGAYEIRSSYGSTVVKSLSMMALSIGSMMSLAYYFSHNQEPPLEEKSSLIIHDSVFVIPFGEEEEDIKPEEKVEAKKTDPAAGDNTTESTRISDSTQVTTTVSLSTGSTGTSTSVDPNALAGTGNSTLATNPSTITGGGGKKETVKNGFEVDEMPKFAGGLGALNAFIRTHLVYPQVAIDGGESGIVYARFVVDEDGKVTEVELQRALTPALNTEALRVLNMIPKFESPGKSKGEPVKTYYQLPIKFSLH